MDSVEDLHILTQSELRSRRLQFYAKYIHIHLIQHILELFLVNELSCIIQTFYFLLHFPAYVLDSDFYKVVSCGDFYGVVIEKDNILFIGEYFKANMLNTLIIVPLEYIGLDFNDRVVGVYCFYNRIIILTNTNQLYYHDSFLHNKGEKFVKFHKDELKGTIIDVIGNAEPILILTSHALYLTNAKYGKCTSSPLIIIDASPHTITSIICTDFVFIMIKNGLYYVIMVDENDSFTITPIDHYYTCKIVSFYGYFNYVNTLFDNNTFITWDIEYNNETNSFHIGSFRNFKHFDDKGLCTYFQDGTNGLIKYIVSNAESVVIITDKGVYKVDQWLDTIHNITNHICDDTQNEYVTYIHLNIENKYYYHIVQTTKSLYTLNEDFTNATKIEFKRLSELKPI